MTVFRRILLVLVNFFFRFSLFSGLTLLATVLMISNPNTIKNVLRDINAYDRFSQSIIDSAKSNPNTNPNPNSIPLDSPEIQNAIKNSLDSATLIKISDNFINSSYDWLEGKTKDIEFSVDLTPNKQVLAGNIANYAIQRIAGLDPCTSAPTQTSVFTVECNPTGVDLGELRKEVVKMIVEDKTVLPNNILTLDNLPKASDGQTFTQAYSNAPKYFQLLKIAPFVLLGVSLLCALIIIFTSRTKRRGLKSVGSSLIATAIIMTITPLIYIYALPALGFKPPNFSGDDQSVSVIVNDSITQLYSAFNAMLINVAIQTALVGVVILIICRFLKSNSSLYVNLEKKSGLTASEPSAKQRKTNSELPNIPVQTSESNVKKTKKVSALEKKYRKM